MAMYLGNTKVSGAGVQVDSALSDSSTRPVENKVITAALENVGYDAWKKPSDWIDIRSGAVSDSVYFLVAHSEDYTQYPTFGVNVTVTNAGTYDVYVDGLKQATTASGADTVLNWQTLALKSGYNVAYPRALKTHIVRVSPTLGTNSLQQIRLASEGGALWEHYTTKNAISLDSHSGVNEQRAPLLESITSDSKELLVSNLYRAFWNLRALQVVPAFNCNNSNMDFTGTFAFCYALKKVSIKNSATKVESQASSMFYNCLVLKKIELNNVKLGFSTTQFYRCHELQDVPSCSFSSTTGNNMDAVFTEATTLNPFFLDASDKTTMSALRIGGSNSYRIDGLKGLVVSNEAPFNNTTIPQLNLSYTGLDRQALVNLFKSMPTVSAGQVCAITGTTGANDLTAEDLAIATDKGWTITR